MKQRQLATSFLFLFVGCASSQRVNSDGYKVLEQLQQHAYECTGARRSSDEDRARAVAEFKQLIADRAKSGQRVPSMGTVDQMVRELLSTPLPTRFEEPATYALLNWHSAKIIAAARASGLAVNRPLLFGTLPLPLVNAEAIPHGDGDYIVVVDTDLFKFCGAIMKVVLQTIEIVPVGDGTTVRLDYSDAMFERRMSSHPEIQLQFVTLLLEFIQILPMEHVARLDHNYDRLFEIENAMELFVVGHEVAHVVREHYALGLVPRRFADANAKCTSICDTALTVNVVTRSWMQELEADYIGAALTAQAIHTDNDSITREYSKYGPLLFLAFMSFLDDAKFIVTNGTEPPEPSETEIEAAMAILRRGLESGFDGTNELDRSPVTTLGSHPPFWLRQVMVQHSLQLQMAKSLNESSAVQRELLPVGAALVENANKIWRMARKHLLTVYPILHKTKRSPNAE